MPSDEDTPLLELRRLVADFVRQREWEQFHDPKNLSMAITTEASELMELFRWVTNDASDELMKDEAARQAVAEELADILAFTLGFANRCNIDLTGALRAKMTKNAAKYPADKYKGRY